MKRAYRTSASAKRRRIIKRRPPHRGVYVRLAPSPIHGVGVFAIRKIPKGTNIFPDDDEPIHWFRSRELRRVSREIKRLYKDFCIIRDHGKSYGCPKSFNQLTPAWFLNEPEAGKKPNVRADRGYNFYAIEDIQPGDELTVEYRTYSEEPQRQ
jgi:SET domain-containing protein